MNLSKETIHNIFFEKVRSYTARSCKAPASVSQIFFEEGIRVIA